MKRWYLAAVAGLSWFAPVSAQEGSLAPTAPVVPAPMFKNGTVTPPSGNWGSGSRPILLAKWSPFRNPATASATDPIAPSATVYGNPMPLPTGADGIDGACGAGGCGTGHGRDRMCWARMKAFLCYHPSKTELPKLRPTPYITPLIGMFPCSSGPYGGCAPVANAGVYPAQQGQPLSPPQPYTPPMGKPMPQPVPAGTAGAVTMPPRGTQGTAFQPTWQGRVSPAPQGTGVAGYRFATPEGQSAGNPNPVVNTSLKVPAPK